MKRIALLGMLLVSATAVAGWKVVEPGTVATASSAGFSVQPPSGWVYDTGSRHVVAARNGVLLDALRVSLLSHKTAFKALKKPSTADALPEDLAESYVANLQAEGTYQEVQLVSIEPAELGGRPAFRVRLTYRLPDALGGARMEQVAIGTALKEGLLLATYEGPRIHFFEASLPAAEEALRSVTLAPGK
jgi:hypothetical protein